MLPGLQKCRTVAVAIISFAGVSSGFSQVGSYEWPGYGGNAQHSAESGIAPTGLRRIAWSHSLDTNPPYSGNELLLHFGEPTITPNNNVVVAVRHGSASPSIYAYASGSGKVIWSAQTTYQYPSSNWIPSYGPTLLPTTALTILGRHPALSPLVVWPESGGRLGVRDTADVPRGKLSTFAFYGNMAYAANHAAMDATVQICTPITVGSDGSIYFGFFVSGANPLGLTSGLAIISSTGVVGYIPATALVPLDGAIDRVPFNAAPAVSADGKKLYVSVSAGYSGHGYLIGINTTNFSLIGRQELMDPLSNTPGTVTCDSTSSPLIGTDGDVYYGVLENSFGSNHLRGWLLHFDGALAGAKIPGQFGWDITPSIVPSYLVPSYQGFSPYLLMSKYNNYVEGGGDGVNKVAILDPNDIQFNAVNNVTEMKEVMSIAGPTPDTRFRPGFPNAVREWCINSAAVDTIGGNGLLNCEDGAVYMWNFRTGQLTQKVQLTTGIGEAYTSTAIGPDGTAYAISNAVLYAITGFTRIQFHF